MAQPTPYTRQFNLTTYALNNPAAPYNAANVDAEFNAVLTTLDETLANLALIQRDDGGLFNGVVTPDSLNQATINMIGEWNPRGAWVTATNYAVRDMVTPTGGTITYVCAVAHTSGATFAGDLALGYWQQVNGAGIGTLLPSNITFTATDRILGRASAGAGIGEEIVCTAAGRALLDDASAAAQRTTLGLGATDDPTFNNLIVDSLDVTSFTDNGMLYVNAAGLLLSTIAATDGQLLIGATGFSPVLGTLTGTANRVTVTNGGGTITLSGPQDLAATSSPTFAAVSLSNLSLGHVVYVGASSTLRQDTNTFVYDDTNNRLGIGVASPTYDVDASGSGTRGFRFVSTNGAVEGYITSGAAASNALLRLEAPGLGAGNPMVQFRSTGVSDWSIGVDGDVSGGPFKISAAFGLGTLDYFVLDSSGMEVRNGAVASMRLRVFNTWTSATNFETGYLGWAANAFQVGTEKGSGGGTARPLALVTDGTNRWLVGSTSGILQPATNNTYDIGASALRVLGVWANVYQTSAPVTETGTTHTVAPTTSHLICNNALAVTVTLPAAASFTGRQLWIRSITAGTVVSNASNVVPQVGGAAGTAIIGAVDGGWAFLVSDGTNWEIMASSSV